MVLELSGWKSEVPQLETPYFSTVAFCDFILNNRGLADGTSVLDIGTGIGANLHYFNRRCPNVKFTGADNNAQKIDEARQLADLRELNDISFETLDWFALPSEYCNRFDGIINIHTLCCFKHVDVAIEALCKLEPKWVAFNSLFWPGDLDVMIHIRDHNNSYLTDGNPEGDFNIFSLNRLAAVFNRQGYDVVAEPFFPPEPIPRKTSVDRGTYTIKTEMHDRTQFSGPVHLPWHFVFATKRESA